METFSTLLALCVGNSPVAGEFPTQISVTRSFGVFFDLRLEKNAWVNNREAGDLRRHRAHYDAIVMMPPWGFSPSDGEAEIFSKRVKSSIISDAPTSPGAVALTI